MAPKSHSAKPASGFKAKSTSSTSAVKTKQELLNHKPGSYLVFLCDNYSLHPKNTAVSPSAKGNKKIKQELLKGHKLG
jgi:hypothetical protein